MSGDDVEALAEVVAGIDGGRLADASQRAHDACLRAANAVLASDWLAAHDARVRVETLVEVGRRLLAIRPATDVGRLQLSRKHREDELARLASRRVLNDAASLVRGMAEAGEQHG